MTRAAIYCRLSLDPTGAGRKVEEQEADCRAIAKARGWKVEDQHVLIDNDLSAWRRGVKRPGWDQLVELVEDKAVDAIVVWHPDRLMRQPRDLERLLDARDSGIMLASTGGERDLSNPDDVFILRIEVAHACRSSEDTSRRVQRGHKAAAERGSPGGGGLRPYGYEPDRVTIRESEAAVIREAATRLLAGEPLWTVTSDFAQREIPTARGGRWHTSTLRICLMRPRLAGLREHKGEVIGPASWPAILTLEEHHALRTLFDPRRSGPQRPVVAWLSGTVRCGECGTAMTTRYARGVRRYACPPPQLGGCAHVVRDAAKVEGLIYDLIAAKLATVDLRRVEDDREAAEALAAEQAERDRTFLVDLAARWGRGLMSAEEYDAARAPVDARRKAAARDALPRELRADDPLKAWEDAVPEQRKRIARALLDSVTIDRCPNRSARRVFDPALLRVTWR